MKPTPNFISITNLYEAAFLVAFGFICDLIPRPHGGFVFEFQATDELIIAKSAFARDTNLQAFLANVERLKADMRNSSQRR